MGPGSTHSGRPMVLLATLCALATCVPATAGAGPLPLTIGRIHPVDDAGTTVRAGREAARVPGDPDLFKVKADLWLRNSGGADLEVASVTNSYTNDNAVYWLAGGARSRASAWSRRSRRSCRCNHG